MRTVESVAEGHPDKICDQISDAILDEYLRQDPNSRVAVEVFGSHGLLVIGGEVTSRTEIRPEIIAEEVYKKIGHTDKLEILVNLEKQSPDISIGVDTGGAGDQGIMYGYATDETSEFLPKILVMAHALTRGLADLRKHHPDFFWLGPDGKSQITMEGKDVKSVLVSTQHSESIANEVIKEMLTRHLIRPIVGQLDDIDILINPTGRFVKGGFMADTGLTGRKIMVDTYGGLLPHGGGAFSGKDPSKVDRSAAYMCRYVAKNIVANELAKNCLVSVAYAIGRAEPLMISARSSDGKDLSALVKEKFDFRPKAIIERLNLLRPIYQQTASCGHFGKPELPWEDIVVL